MFVGKMSDIHRITNRRPPTALALTNLCPPALPALIALLSDSYAQIQESATANKRLARCELIADYLNILPRRWRKRSERAAAKEVLERSNLQKIIFLRATGQVGKLIEKKRVSCVHRLRCPSVPP